MIDEEGLFLLRKSSLTKTQFDAFIIRMVKKGKISPNVYEELSKNFRTRGAIAGSFIQAKANIKESLYTILLLFYLGIWKGREREILDSLIRGAITMANSDDKKRKEIRRYMERIVDMMT
jgi:hypothetical protein